MVSIQFCDNQVGMKKSPIVLVVAWLAAIARLPGVGALDLVAVVKHAAINRHAAIVADDQVVRTVDLSGGAVTTMNDHAFPASVMGRPSRG